MKKYRVCDLVEDFDLYPRRHVDSQHIAYMVVAMESGVDFPPIVIDKKTKAIIDGVHRKRAYVKLFGESHEVDCVEKTYRNTAAAFLDAMRFNSSHGRTLDQCDRTHCLLRAEELAISHDQVASALNITTAKVGELHAGRVGLLQSVKGEKRKVALKQTIAHMSGVTLTDGQRVANDKLSGMNQAFYANQLILLLDNNLVDWSRDSVTNAFKELYDLLGAKLPGQIAAE